jgi:hypothetical protein
LQTITKATMEEVLRSTGSVSHWSPPLSVSVLWGNIVLGNLPTGIRRGITYAKVQEHAFKLMTEQKATKSTDGEGVPTCKEDIRFVVGGVRLRKKTKCVASDITDMLENDVGDKVHLRLHNKNSSYKTRTLSFKNKIRSTVAGKCELIKEFLDKKEGFIVEGTDSKKCEVKLQREASFAFFEVPEEMIEGSLGVIVGVYDLKPGDKAVCTFTDVIVPKEQVLQLCSRRSTGGWYVEKTVEKGSAITFNIEKNGAYMVRRYEMIIGLPIDVKLLDHKYDMTYAKTDDGPYLRGGREYNLPRGYKRIALKRPNFNKYEKWCVAYHGTNPTAVLSIIRDNLLKPLNTPAHGAQETMLTPHDGHIKLTTKVFGIEGFADAVFVSPNIEYASADAYACKYEFEGKKYKIVIQVRVNSAPGSFSEHASTLLGTKFKYSKVEWRVPKPEDVFVYGLLYKEIE